MSDALAGGTALAWHTHDWLDGARAWIERHVGPIATLEVHSEKRYSVVASVETDDGRLWLKELSSGVLLPGVHAPESLLTSAVARIVPHRVAEVIAADDTWLLTRHAGPTISRVVRKSGLAGGDSRWDQVAASYAEMQIELVPAAHDLPAPDARPATLAQTGDAAATALIEQLGDAIPPSLALYGSHGDNICLRHGAAVFIDWKSAVHGHPFCGLHTLLLKLVDRFRAVVGGPDVMRIRDAYLEPWTAFAPIAELRRAFGLANALAPFYKVLKVERALESETFPIEWRERYSRKAARYRAIFEALVASPDLLGLGRLPRS